MSDAIRSSMTGARRVGVFRDDLLTGLEEGLSWLVAPDYLPFRGVAKTIGLKVVVAERFGDRIRESGWYAGHDPDVYDALFQSTIDHEVVGHAYFMAAEQIHDRRPPGCFEPSARRRTAAERAAVMEEQRALATQYLLSSAREGDAWNYVRHKIAETMQPYLDSVRQWQELPWLWYEKRLWGVYGVGNLSAGVQGD